LGIHDPGFLMRSFIAAVSITFAVLPGNVRADETNPTKMMTAAAVALMTASVHQGNVRVISGDLALVEGSKVSIRKKGDCVYGQFDQSDPDHPSFMIVDFGKLTGEYRASPSGVDFLGSGTVECLQIPGQPAGCLAAFSASYAPGLVARRFIDNVAYILKNGCRANPQDPDPY
jgi:hypothetical protein